MVDFSVLSVDQAKEGEGGVPISPVGHSLWKILMILDDSFRYGSRLTCIFVNIH
jgi:hypothetical protein